MKLTTVLFTTMALFGSLSVVSAQEVPTTSMAPSSCWMYQPVVTEALGLTENQCGRISLVWSGEVQLSLERLYNEVTPLENEANNLNWVTPTQDDSEAVLRQLNDVNRKRFAVRLKIKTIVDERNRKSLEVMNAKQRLMLAVIDSQAELVHRFGIFANTGLITGYSSSVFINNPAKGSDDRLRQ